MNAASCTLLQKRKAQLEEYNRLINSPYSEDPEEKALRDWDLNFLFLAICQQFLEEEDTANNLESKE